MNAVRAIALDVDGVLTDNTFIWGALGEEFKRFSFADVMGIARAQRAGVQFALISGEDSPLVTRFAEKLGIQHVYRGCKDKAQALAAFAADASVPLAEVCFMGNDINDVEAMTMCGISAAPADAHARAIERAAVVTTQPGGHGAVRELIDALVLNSIA